MNGAPDQDIAVFTKALRLPPDERDRYLSEACKGDAEFRLRVEALLQAYEQAGDFLGRSAANRPARAVQAFPAGEKPGDRIGRYKLLQQIGEGGCGVVYMAEQEEPVRRRVALKIIKPGMDTKNVIGRFEAERQALALMNHPNIAKVFDAGATESGHPYFVMELVRGVKITEYCDRHSLTTEDRLQLFVQVCQAVQHAHQKGIIHRDIKPSNILVTQSLEGVAMPMVIDFGVAKATTDQPLTDKTVFTAFEMLIGTPAYMSPEQAALSSVDVDTRTDIYSLGVLLYELLTSSTPFEIGHLLKSGLDEIRRVIREEEPPRPSTRLSKMTEADLTTIAQHRRSEPPRLIRAISGDLDWIAMKAMEKNRTRRYETANGLALDIHRHLDHEPVLARAPSRWYRFQKLVQRHRIVFASGGAVVVALLLGTIISTRLFFKERDARASAERLGRDAEIRERVSHIALLVAQHHFEEADKLLPQIPLNEPSIEIAAELRSLGDWHAANGRWRNAVDRLGAVVNLDQLDSPDLISSDKLKLAAALLQAGDRRGYEQLRQAAVASFTPVSDPTAYSLLKIGLLLPPESSMLQSLAAGAEAFARRFPKEDELRPNPPYWAQWAESLALLEYRRGHFAQAVSWCDRCLKYDAPMFSTTLFIKAMCNWREQHWTVADWTEGCELIQAKSRNGFELGASPSAIFPTASAGEYLEGSWFDWACASLLMRECNDVIAETDQAVASAPIPKLVPEQAAMFRALGEWHAIRGEWEQAHQRFDYVQHSNQQDSVTVAARDYLHTAIASLQMGDEPGFLRLRVEAVSRFKDSDDADPIARADAAVRVLEIALLRPVDKTLAESLEPFAQFLTHKLANVEIAKSNPQYISWYSMLLGLFEYRRGNYAKALDWCRHSIEICQGFFSLPTATDHVIIAMSRHKLGENIAGRSELARASTLADLGLNREFDKWFWRDWVCVRLLLREANLLMQEEPLPTSTPASR